MSGQLLTASLSVVIPPNLHVLCRNESIHQNKQHTEAQKHTQTNVHNTLSFKWKINFYLFSNLSHQIEGFFLGTNFW